MAKTLTAKQQRFVEEYMTDLNATQAAIRAGYSEKTAGSIGQQNLIKLEVASEIAARKKALSKKTEITLDRVITELGAIALVEIPHEYITVGEKISALNLLGRHFGAFPTKVEHTGAGGGPIRHAAIHGIAEMSDEQAARFYRDFVNVPARLPGA